MHVYRCITYFTISKYNYDTCRIFKQLYAMCPGVVVDMCSAQTVTVPEGIIRSHEHFPRPYGGAKRTCVLRFPVRETTQFTFKSDYYDVSPTDTLSVIYKFENGTCKLHQGPMHWTSGHVFVMSTGFLELEFIRCDSELSHKGFILRFVSKYAYV
jgi:hypothetical protein